ncbi:actin binding protein [Tieghemostelium lacteum]|uniref:Actin binding protein n=1 Tax=Tieghemostelium lacteum TaxID=361077 RepID=A0A151ZE39_TIELA|nr:actin binding protein [Tieghemostelium lacteum]|eukprot:KYQ92195.1 actin binding protein [Tieghemostelium lacteum]
MEPNENSTNNNTGAINRPTMDMKLFTGVTIFDENIDDQLLNSMDVDNDNANGNNNNNQKMTQTQKNSEIMKIWMSEYYLSLIGYHQQREKRLNEFYQDIDNPNASPVSKEERKNLEYEHFQKETSYLRIKRKTIQKQFEPLFEFGDHKGKKKDKTVRRSGTFSPTSMQLAQSPELKNTPIHNPNNNNSNSAYPQTPNSVVKKINRYSLTSVPIVTTTTATSTTYSDSLSPLSSPTTSHENLGNTVLFTKPPLEDPEMVKKSRPLSMTLDSLDRRRTKSVSSIKKDKIGSGSGNSEFAPSGNGLTMEFQNFTPVKSTPLNSKSRTMMFKFDTKSILEETEKLLQEKEEDTRIAAEIGKELLDKNYDLEKEMSQLKAKLLEHEQYFKEMNQENEKLKTENILLSSNISYARMENESLIIKESALSNQLNQQSEWLRSEHSPMKNKTIQQQKEVIEELKSTVADLQQSQGKLLKNRDKLKNANEMLQTSMLDLKDQLTEKIDPKELTALKNKLSNLRSKNRQLQIQLEQNLNNSSDAMVVKDPEVIIKTAFNEMISNEELLSVTPRITSLKLLSDAKYLISKMESEISNIQDVSLISTLLKYLEQESQSTVNINDLVLSNLNDSFESSNSQLSDPKSALYMLICVVTIQKYTKYDKSRIREIEDNVDESSKEKALKYQVENQSLKKSLEELELIVDEYKLKNSKLQDDLIQLKESSQSNFQDDELSSYFSNNNNSQKNQDDLELLKKAFEDQLSVIQLELEATKQSYLNLESEMQQQLNEKDDNMDRYMKQLESILKEFEEKESLISKLTEDLSKKQLELQEKLDLVSKQEMELINVAQQLDSKDLQIQESDQKLKQAIGDLEQLKLQYDQLNKNIEGLTNDLVEKEKQIADLNQQISDMKLGTNQDKDALSNTILEKDQSIRDKDLEITRLLNKALESDQLLSSKDKEISKLVEEIKAKDEIISNHLKEISNLLNTITEKDEKIASLDQEISKLHITVNEKDQAINGKDSEISNLSQSNKHKDSQISSKDDEISKLHITVSEKDQTINGKDSEISNLSQSNKDKDNEISKLQETIIEKDTQLSNKDDEVSKLVQSNKDKDSELTSKQEEITKLQQSNSDKDSQLSSKDEEISKLQNSNSEKDQIITSRDNSIKDKDLEISNLQQRNQQQEDIIREKDLEISKLRVSQSNSDNDKDKTIIDLHDQVRLLKELLEKKSLEKEQNDRHHIEQLQNSTVTLDSQLKLLGDHVSERIANMENNRIKITNDIILYISKLNGDLSELRLENQRLLSEISDLKTFIEMQSKQSSDTLEEKTDSLIIELQKSKEEFELVQLEKKELQEKVERLVNRSRSLKFEKKELSMRVIDLSQQVKNKEDEEEIKKLEIERKLEENKIVLPNYPTKDYYIEMEEPLVDFINQNLPTDKDIENVFPINFNRHILYSFYDGVLLSKIVNLSRPGTIDERVMNIKPNTKIEVEQNFNLVINSARAIGCVIPNESNPLSFLKDEPIDLINLIYELVKVYLTNNITISNYPSLMVLKTTKEQTKNFIGQSATQLLNRWVLYHLGIKKSKQSIEEILLLPTNCIKLLSKLDKDFSEKSDDELSLLFNSFIPRFDLFPWLTLTSYNNKNQKLIYLFIISLFTSKRGIGIQEEANKADQEELKKVVELSFKDIEGTREERAFCIWLNSLNITPYVHNLQQDLQDGLVILQMFDKINPGSFSWTKDGVYNNPSNVYQEVENCNIGIRIAKKMGFSLVGIDGKNIHDCNRKLTLSVIWQACKYHYLSILRSLRKTVTEGTNKDFTEVDITNWANNKVKSIGKSTAILGFRDPAISNGKFLLDLLEAVQPGTVNYNLVQEGTTYDEKKSNAQYIINSARKIGCYIFVVEDDIVDVKQKMIMTLVASLMTKDLSITKKQSNEHNVLSDEE